MEKLKEKLNLKIIIAIAVIVLVAIVITMAIGGDDQRFKEVAHICNNLGGLPGMQLTSPKVLDIWYFEEEDHSGKDVIICFTADNTSSKYYQYFMWNEDSTDFTSMCYAKDEVRTNNIVFRNSSADTETILNCSALMLQAMKQENKLEDKQIQKINKLLNSGKITKYENYQISK